MIQVGCQVYILLAVYQEESIFMLLVPVYDFKLGWVVLHPSAKGFFKTIH